MADNGKLVKSGIIALSIVLALTALASVYFLRQRIEEPIVPGPGVTRIGMLSEYFDGIKGSVADTEVYYFEGKRPGPTVFIMGGNHPCEPDALLAPIVFIENAVVEKGKLIVVPRGMKSGFSSTEPGTAFPPRFHIKQDDGNMRWFRFGTRRMMPVYSWPNPTVYTHYPSGQTLSEGEALNLNRNFPGRPNGRLTEKLGYAMTELIKKENAIIAFDYHEAPADRTLVNAMAVHENATDIATIALLNMELFWNAKVRLELSPKNLHAISHREWGDYTGTAAVLIETCSPLHGPVRGKATEWLALTSKDEFELMAGKAGRLFTDYDENGYPISVRDARHVQNTLEVINAHNELNPNDQIIITNMPNYDEIINNGVGTYLAVVKEPAPRLFPIPGIEEFFFNQGRPFWGYMSGYEYDKVLGAKKVK